MHCKLRYDKTTKQFQPNNHGKPMTELNVKDKMKEKIIEVLMSIYDPEIPVNIYDLGLIYGLDVSEQAEVRIQMTLTSPACPVAQTFPGIVQDRVLSVPGI